MFQLRYLTVSRSSQAKPSRASSAQKCEQVRSRSEPKIPVLGAHIFCFMIIYLLDQLPQSTHPYMIFCSYMIFCFHDHLSCGYAPLAGGAGTFPNCLDGSTILRMARRPWKCRLGFHDWDDRENRETHERYSVCLRCNAHRDRGRAYPGEDVVPDSGDEQGSQWPEPKGPLD